MNANKLIFLVVEDDSFQRHVLIDLLTILGAKNILEAADGAQALNIFRDPDGPHIDIVLCDLNMPEMDGMEFFRHLGSYRSGISTIIISAENSALITSVKNMVRAYGLRLLGAIEKPITLAGLQKLISLHTPLHTPSEHKASNTPNFGLEEILQGIQQEQFEPFFQPKMDIATQKIVGAEALARWIHPDHGVVSPYAFIELLEESNNIDELTLMILKKATEACRLLHDNGHEINISINISLTSLTDISMADKIIQLVQNSGIGPHHVTLEITESAAMTDVAHALENLARLRMHGFGLSIDDYGTGYSSMQQITRIAFSELKIDQSFVKDIADNHALRVIVDSSIGMARKLGIKSTAEGVETQHDLDVLKSMGCDIAQGYFIARPMNFPAFLQFCEAS